MEKDCILTGLCRLARFSYYLPQGPSDLRIRKRKTVLEQAGGDDPLPLEHYRSKLTEDNAQHKRRGAEKAWSLQYLSECRGQIPVAHGVRGAEVYRSLDVVIIKDE